MTKNTNLNRSRPESEYLVSGSFSVPVHVDEDVDSVCVDAVCGLPVTRVLREVDEKLTLTFHFLTETCVVVRCERVTVDLVKKTGIR